jgi:phage-related protein
MNGTNNRLPGSAVRDRIRERKERRLPGQRVLRWTGPIGQVKLMALFQIAGDHGKFYNPEKFGDLGGGLFEFKSFQVRMPFAYAKSERGLILITHGFVKKKSKTPKNEIARAWRIYEEDQAQPKLAIIRKGKR